jgi:hypothetical protein
MAPWPCTHAAAQQQPNNPTTARAAGDGRRSRQCCLRQWAISWPRSGQSGHPAVAVPEAAGAAEGREVAMQPRGRREAAEQPEAAGGGHCRRPAAAKLWLWAATVSAAAAAISGHSRFSSLALVFLVSLALREGPSQGDVLPFSVVLAPPTPCLCVDRCFPLLCSAYLHSLFVPQEALVVAVGAAGSATRRGSSAIKANVSRQ